MISLRVPTALLAAFVLTGWRERAPAWPVAGPMPDAPGHASPYTYEPVDKGTRRYRPVDPLPWGDVNRRVAPASAIPSATTASPPAAQEMQKPPTPNTSAPESPAPLATPQPPAKADLVPAEPPADPGQHQGQ